MWTGYTGQSQAERPWQLLSSQCAGAGWQKGTLGATVELDLRLSQFARADLCPSESTHMWFLAEVWGSKCKQVAVCSQEGVR